MSRGVFQGDLLVLAVLYLRCFQVCFISVTPSDAFAFHHIKTQGPSFGSLWFRFQGPAIGFAVGLNIASSRSSEWSIASIDRSG